WAFLYFQTESAQTRWLTDPALEFVAGAQPPELKRLAKRINQFTPLDVAMTLARDAGFHCDAKRYADVANGSTGPRIMICPKGSDEVKAGGKVLLLRSWFPQNYVRGLDLREMRTLPTAPFKATDIADRAQIIAAANGIAFTSVSSLVDVVADRFEGNYFPNCVGEKTTPEFADKCAGLYEQRFKAGAPRWSGKPVNAGKHVDAVMLLVQLGMECGNPAFTEVAGGSEPDIATVQCEARSFAAQPQLVFLETDARTVIPRALVVQLPGQEQRIDLAGRAPDNNPLAISIMARTLAGDFKILTISSPPADWGASDAFKAMVSFDAVSQRRLTRAFVMRIETQLTAPKDASATSELQRLDAAADLLARLGAETVGMAVADTAGLKPGTVAAIALASCRVKAEAPDCLKKMVLAETSLRDTLTAALDEAKKLTPETPADSPARQRLTRLAAQLAAVDK
ncbi:MAG: hypothetical protein K8S22_17645, partial [Betaproteobacteria bacterium]|nr:hypothetical protein [Betaproteobacteria bacterium]